MPTKQQITLALAVIVAAVCLTLWRCGQAPAAGPQGSPGESSPASREASEAAKSQERLPSKKRTEDEVALAKIKFKLDDIRPDGLRGPDDGLTTVSYEFCVPKDEATFEELRRIAPGIAIHTGSKGRIGCSEDQALCIGTTGGANWRETLLAIARLGYVAEIYECHFE